MKSFIVFFGFIFAVFGQVSYDIRDKQELRFQPEDIFLRSRETRQSPPRRPSKIRFEDSPSEPVIGNVPSQGFAPSGHSQRPSSPFLFTTTGNVPGLRPLSQPQQQHAQLQTQKPRPSLVIFEPSSGTPDQNQGNSFELPNFSRPQLSPPKPCIDLNGKQGICQEHVKCALYQPEYVEKKKISGVNIKCQLSGGTSGICCGTVLKNKDIDASVFIKKKAKHDNNLEMRLGGASFVQNNIDQAANQISNLEKQHLIVENRLVQESTPVVKKGSSSHGHLLFFQTSKKAIEISHFGFSLMESSRDISKRFQLPAKDSGESLLKYNLPKNSDHKRKCPAAPVCDPKHRNYRSIDGTCNNLRVTNLGASFTPLMRVLEPDYADGVWSPRVARGGLPLPSARLLSNSLIGDRDAPDLRFSLHVMQFGQFVDHDLSHVPVFRYPNGAGIECCSEGGLGVLPPRLTHPFCLPIEISSRDSFYRHYHQSCMNFVRSMISPRLDCSFGYADQMNQITHWLDSSNVYGSTKEDEDGLRLFRDGKLKTSAAARFPGHGAHRKEHLPLQEERGDSCTTPEAGVHCFKAGDSRVNEMIGLTVTHLIWVREHNRLASELKLVNPSWNDGKLYQEARRILNAEYQHMLYNEWLPIMIGTKYMEVYGILPLTHGYSYDYDDRIDPSVSNAFAAAAFRVGHTLIQGILQLVNELGIVDEQMVIHEHFNSPFRIREEGLLDKVLRTLSSEPIQRFDNLVTSEVTQRLFQPRNQHFGMDLIALNIQRGREHGIPGYNHYRQECKIGRVESFQGFTDWIPSSYVQLLSQYYSHVDDVDLFIGGMGERPLPGAILGPTFTCIIGDQFARSKKADRFSYDLGGQESSFSPDQLNQIRRVSYARILCDNSDRIPRMQPYAFLLPDAEFNQLVPCESLPRMDLSFWRQ